MPFSLAFWQAVIQILVISSEIAGVIPEKWNHVAPSNISSQLKSSAVASANAEPALL